MSLQNVIHSSYIIWLALSYPITGILWLILTFSSPLSIIILYGLQATPYPFSPLLDHRLLNLRLPFCHLDWDFPWLLKVSLISILRQTSPQNLADDEEGLHWWSYDLIHLLLHDFNLHHLQITCISVLRFSRCWRMNWGRAYCFCLGDVSVVRSSGYLSVGHRQAQSSELVWQYIHWQLCCVLIIIFKFPKL